MFRRYVFLAAVAAAFLSAPLPALADKRIALVVGNSNYQNVARLENPRNDAALMATTLRSLGFTLVGDGPQLDLDKAALDLAHYRLPNVMARLRNGETVDVDAETPARLAVSSDEVGQVQQAIVSVFRKFQQLGSARQATIWFREEQILVPKTKPGTAGQEVIWGLPSSGRIRQMLKNPCYAGTFAYGKTAARTRIEEGRAAMERGDLDGPGGAVAVCVAGGGVARVIALSYGERGESGELWKQEGQTVERVKRSRHGEAERSAAALGADFRCLDLGDYPLEIDRDDLVAISDEIRSFAPDVLITHTDTDPFNPDHPVAYEAVQRSRGLAAGAGVAAGGLASSVIAALTLVVR